MYKILEVNEEGALVVPADLLNGAEPHQRYTAESVSGNLVLRPESASGSPEDREQCFLESMLEAGLISEIKPLSRRSLLNRPPVPITGKPLSDTIIEERR